MLRRRFLTAAVAAALGWLVAPAAAEAGFRVDYTITGGPGASGSIIDNTSATDTDARTGVIRFDVFEAGVTIEIANTRSISNALGVPPGTGGLVDPPFISGELFSSGVSITNSSGAARTVTLTISDDGFTIPGASGAKLAILDCLDLTSSNALSSGVTLSAVTKISDGGGSATTTPIVVPGPVSAGGTLYSDTPLFLRSSPTYTLASINTLTFAGDGVANFSTTSFAYAPAPATAILALAGAPLFGLVGWLRRRSAVPAVA